MTLFDLGGNLSKDLSLLAAAAGIYNTYVYTWAILIRASAIVKSE